MGGERGEPDILCLFGFDAGEADRKTAQARGSTSTELKLHNR